MAHIKRLGMIFVVLVSLSGCATIVTSNAQKIPISSDPSGAVFEVDGKDSNTTPATIRLKRQRDYIIFFKKEGYKPQDVKLMHVLSGAFCGNVFLGGPLGMALDMLTGSQYKLIPEKIHVKLEKM